MSEPQIFPHLRSLLEVYNTRKLAEEVKIPYMKLYRFKKNLYPLSVEDTDKLCVFLTGKSFIAIKDVL